VSRFIPVSDKYNLSYGRDTPGFYKFATYNGAKSFSRTPGLLVTLFQTA
jgi:hypothetical protein